MVNTEASPAAKAMLIFFDTEFTELGIDPRLISIGLISEFGDRTFYAELSDTYTEKDCSEFVRLAVLPHLEGGNSVMAVAEPTPNSVMPESAKVQC